LEARGFRAGVSGAVSYATTSVLLLLLLVAAARPIATDDVWWHLALGRVFAREGPWLGSDPLLFTAVRPASNSSWLADVALARLFEQFGFSGLRVAHAVCAAAILVLAAALLRREAASSRIASLAVIGFATLSAYRLFQLRPDLSTLLATLLLYALVLRPRAGPSLRRIALCAVGMALWANLHPGFLLGPILIGVALIGVAAAAQVTGPSAVDRLRIRRLLWCSIAGGLATLANPSGASPHLAYFAAGERSPTLSLVRDEWAPLALFSWPSWAGPPSRAEWLWVWVLLLGTMAASVSLFGELRERAEPAARGPGALDPALVAIAWAALAAMAIAVRFLWLGIFPLLLLAQWAADWRALRAWTWTSWLPGLLGPILLASFLWIGPRPRISGGLGGISNRYDQPYAAAKYPVDSIWLIRDAGLEGRLFTDYLIGGYAGFWLTPKIQTFINGSLNVPPDTMKVFLAIRARRPMPGESFLDLLDRFDVDLFLGTGTPEGPQGPAYTVAHLERVPGWIPIFRNATSALYLRAHSRRAEANLRRLVDYYASEGIPFDPERGFEPARVVRDHASWAIHHRMIPTRFAALERDAIQSHDPPAHRAALIQTACFYAFLGLCDQAIEREAELRALDPLAVGPRRRTVWCLLRAGRYEEARGAAAPLNGSEDRDPLLKATLELARALPTLSIDAAESTIRRLPLVTAAQTRALESLLESPLARVR